MSFDDFCKQFTNLWILHLLGDRKGHKWHRIELKSEWKGRTAGGCFNHPTFANNPQIGCVPCAWLCPRRAHRIPLAQHHHALHWHKALCVPAAARQTPV